MNMEQVTGATEATGQAYTTNQHTTGLEQPFKACGKGRVRPAAKKLPTRSGSIWNTVNVKLNDKAFTTAPELICKDCKKEFAGGVSRVKQHIKKFCSCSTSELKLLKSSLLEEEKSLAHKMSDKRRVDHVESSLADDERECTAYSAPDIVELDVRGRGATQAQSSDGSLVPDSQQRLNNMVGGITSDLVDDRLVDFILAEGLPFSIAESPQFKEVLRAARLAPSSYTPPNQHRVGGPLLERAVKRLRMEEKPLRDACTTHGCTVVSDGWDDVSNHHLINFLVATNHGAFFDGTVKLSSDDKEDAEAVAELICAEIEKVGPLNVVQVVTDTCSVMKAAWAIIEKKYLWITCTCCAPHVLNLLLKDIGKISEVAAVLLKVSKVLNRFWGRKRWCRIKLREVVLKNRGKNVGLYRAAPSTRFAGKVKEMARMLRLKADLKYIVDLPEYSAQDYRKKKTPGEDDTNDDADELNGEGGVKAIILDEEGFWVPLLDALKVMTPISKTLRMCDSDKPVMGKIYDHIFMLSEKVRSMSIPWASTAADKISERWEYLHSYMHAAGYAFDPEFFEHRNKWDTAVTNGVDEMIERIFLRYVCMNSDDPVRASKELTAESDQVVEVIAKCDVQLSSFREGLGIFTKQKVLLNAKVLAPAAWWSRYCEHLDILCVVARSVLAQVVCSSSAERNWSIYGRIKHKGRAVMGHSKADKVVYCHEAIHLKNKIQKVSYKGSVQPWDTDSDSDAEKSDDEDYIM